MAKNIIGDWGAGLSDRDYARALAALGSLEASGTDQHQVGDDPQKILAALQEEFKNGDHTVVWRAARKCRALDDPAELAGDDSSGRPGPGGRVGITPGPSRPPTAAPAAGGQGRLAKPPRPIRF